MQIPEPIKLPSGKWRVRVADGSGGRRSITRSTKRECLAAAAQIKTGVRQRARRPVLQMLLTEAYDSYITGREARGLSPSTIAGYRRLQHNTMQSLMSLQVRNVTTGRVQREIDDMIRRGLSRKYQANALGLLRSVLADAGAQQLGDICLSPADAPDPDLPQRQDIAAILEGARGNAIELPILLALWMGLRMSEIRGLQYRDIRGGRMHIVRAIVDGPGGVPVEKQPKTISGNRWIPVPEYILSLIPDGDPDERIVTLSGQAIYKRWIRLLDKLGLPRFRFHDLRHANAAVMLSLGIDSRYARQRCGWHTDHMYRQVYGYCMADTESANTQAIDAYFRELQQAGAGGEMATVSDTAP